MVMVTGTGMPFSIFWVCALNALQNSMMLRPRWPSAGPIGGAGFALPAGTCNLRNPVTFFAMSYSLVVRVSAVGSRLTFHDFGLSACHARLRAGHPRLGDQARRGWPGHRRSLERRSSNGLCPAMTVDSLYLLDLSELQFDRGGAAEDRHRNLHP